MRTVKSFIRKSKISVNPSLNLSPQVGHQFGNFKQRRILLPHPGIGALLVVLPREVHLHTPGPRRGVGAPRAPEHPQVGVGTQPVLCDPGKEPYAFAVHAHEEFLGGVIRRDSGVRPG